MRLASANEMTKPSRLGASTSVNCQSAQVSGTLGPRKLQKNAPPTRRSRSAVTGGGGDAQDDRQAHSPADADGRGAYRRGSPAFRGFAAHDRADPQGAGGRGSGGRSGPLEPRGWAATCADHCPGADAGAHAEDPEAPPLEVLRRLREEGHRLGESTFYRLHRAEREGLPKELMVRFEGVTGDSSGSGTSDSRDGAYAATPSASIP